MSHGPAKPKADVTLSMADATFQDLADGKLNGQARRQAAHTG